MRRILIATFAALLTWVPMAPALAHGEGFSLVVEAVRNPDGSMGYGIVLHFSDGDPVEDAEVTLTAAGPDGAETTGKVESTAPGISIATVRFPAPGTWRVTVAFTHEDGDGSASFDQLVPPSADIGTVVVVVDSEHPERVGTVVEGDSALGTGTEPGPSGDLTVPIRVEALVRDEVRPLEVDYAVAADVASVTLSAVGERTGEEVGPVPLERVAGGRFRSRVVFPDADLWTVELLTDRGSVVFHENLPWPHYTVEAGHPKVKVDSEHPEEVGSLLDGPEASDLFGPPDTGGPAGGTPSQGSPDEMPSTEPASTGTTVTASGTVDLDLPSTAEELFRQTLLRWFHLGAIGLWVAGIVLAWRGARLAPWLAGLGVVATVGTGGILALYGAPVTYPGLVRWQDLAARFYGPSYEAAFVAKMGAVVVAATGTLLLLARRSRTAAVVALFGMGGAVLAVTAMVQFHLFAHL